MARYSPGVPGSLPSNPIINHPFLFRSVNMGNTELQPDDNIVELIPNRFGIENAAADFTDVSKIVQYPDSTDFEIQEFTISAWVDSRADIDPGNRAICGVVNDLSFPNNLAFGLLIADNVPGVFINDGSSITFAFAFAEVDQNEDHHYAGTYDGDNLIFYLDAVEQQVIPTSDIINFSDASFIIGQANTAGLLAESYISDVLLYDEAKSDTVINEIYNTQWLRKGKRSGSVFQKSGSSFAIRNRTKPRFQRTARTSLSRNAFHHVQSNWRQLSAGDKTSWSNQVANFGRTNSLGIPYELEPIQLFDSQNKVRVDFQLPIEDTAQAPVAFPSPAIDSVILFPGVPEAFVNVIPVEVPANFVYNVFLSEKLLSPPDNQENQTFYLMASFDEGTDSDVFFTDRWVQKFGITANDVGKYQVFKLEIFHRPTGQRTIDALVTTELEP